VRFILRIVLVAAVFAYFLPDVSGVKFHGDVFSAVATSLVFNIVFIGLEWLLGIIVLGINIGTLGLGVLITNGLKFAASLLAPSAALYGTSHLLPKFLQIAHYWPNAIVAGLVLGGVLWVTIPQGKKK
jgi:uncharacterized membrane protein YvlD (DUF360 family)